MVTANVAGSFKPTVMRPRPSRAFPDVRAILLVATARPVLLSLARRLASSLSISIPFALSQPA
jgi:hypothetical protein